MPEAATAADAAAIAGGTTAVATTTAPASTETAPAPDTASSTATPAVGAPAAPVAQTIPDKYDLKLPQGITVDPALTERTAATARTLGLSNENAQKTLDFVVQEAARETASALSAWSAPSEANPEGGAKWKEQNDAWRAVALTDKELGDGKPEQLAARVELAKKALAKFGDPESIDFIDSALGSNPALLRVLVRIGKAMGEQPLIPAGPPIGQKKPEHKMYNPDGSPLQPQAA